MAAQVHEARGVQWAYLDPEAVEVHRRPDAHECTGCGRWFEATVHTRTGDDRWCPDCKAVESIAHSVDRVLAETDPYPAGMDVGDLMADGVQVR